VKEFHPPEKKDISIIESEEEILVSSESASSLASKYEEKPQFFDHKNFIQRITTHKEKPVSILYVAYLMFFGRGNLRD